jgi:hypothetical protein
MWRIGDGTAWWMLFGTPLGLLVVVAVLVAHLLTDPQVIGS